MHAEAEHLYSANLMRREKRGVAARSVAAAIAITLFKTVIGLMTGSLGILSEAAHSALDLIAAVVTLYSVHVSDLPADSDHQYGHGKVENFSAFVEMALLTLTCVWIVYEAGKRLFFRTVEIEPSVAAFIVMLSSIVVDFWRSRALKKIADKYNSQALQADALHFSTDIGSSSVVVLGLVLVTIGKKYHVAWMHYADPVAALFVAGVVAWVSARMARQTIDSLLDAAPHGVRTKIINALHGVDGVLEVIRTRIRGAGGRYFVDLTLGLDRSVTFQRSEQVVRSVVDTVQRILPSSDVVVHPIPRASSEESIFDRIRAVAAASNFHVHDISVQKLEGHLHVEQHLEMDERLSLKQAHDKVTVLEYEIRHQVPEISSILTHVESEPATMESGREIQQPDPLLERRFQRIAKEFPEIIDVHDVKVKRVRDRLYVSCHCTMEDDLALATVHDLITELEIRFMQDTPALFRVLIHTEPKTDNLR